MDKKKDTNKIVMSVVIVAHPVDTEWKVCWTKFIIISSTALTSQSIKRGNRHLNVPCNFENIATGFLMSFPIFLNWFSINTKVFPELGYGNHEIIWIEHQKSTKNDPEWATHSTTVRHFRSNDAGVEYLRIYWRVFVRNKDLMREDFVIRPFGLGGCHGIIFCASRPSGKGFRKNPVSMCLREPRNGLSFHAPSNSDYKGAEKIRIQWLS